MPEKESSKKLSLVFKNVINDPKNIVNGVLQGDLYTIMFANFQRKFNLVHFSYLLAKKLL